MNQNKKINSILQEGPDAEISFRGSRALAERILNGRVNVKPMMNPRIHNNRKMNISISPRGFTCKNFIGDGGTRREVTALLAPIRMEEKDKTMIAWGCSLGKCCYFPHCRYSRIHNVFEGGDTRKVEASLAPMLSSRG
jgi:hypothetical protein